MRGRLRRPRTSRASEVDRMRERLLRESFPRVQMFILVSLTGGAGFLASFGMLHSGVDGMALRYTLAMGVAYLVFLLLLWCWLRMRADDYADVALETLGGISEGSGCNAAPLAQAPTGLKGGGGTFDGGGASGNVDIPLANADLGIPLADNTAGDNIASIVGEPLSAVGDADEAAVPLAVILLVLGIALSSLFVIWSAPILFAEILIDALLAAGLYRRLRGIEPRHWMRTALRRTIVPFLLTTLVVAGAGWGMQQYAPGARSVGEVFEARA